MKSMFSVFQKSRRRGVTLIEGVLFLILAMSVIVGGIVFFQQATLANRVNDTARATVAIVAETRSMYSSQRDYGADVDITTAVLNSGGVPSNFLNNGGTSIRHPWGGTVIVAGNDQTFRLVLSELASEACVRLASVDSAGLGTLGTGITGIAIANETAGDILPTDASTANAFGLQPTMTPAIAGVGCGNQVEDAFIVVEYDRL